MLKPKSKQTLDIIASNPKITNTDAYLKTHPTVNRNSARASVAELLAKPSSQVYLQKHVSRARDTVVELLESKKDDIRLRSAQDVLDREHGKATQRTEVQTTGVTLTIDLTHSLTD